MEPSLLANLHFVVRVEPDRQSLQKAIGDVQRAFSKAGPIRLPRVEITPPDYRPLESSLKKSLLGALPPVPRAIEIRQVLSRASATGISPRITPADLRFVESLLGRRRAELSLVVHEAASIVSSSASTLNRASAEASVEIGQSMNAVASAVSAAGDVLRDAATAATEGARQLSSGAGDVAKEMGTAIFDAEQAKLHLGQYLEAVRIKPEASSMEMAAQLVADGMLEITDAAVALHIGLKEPKKVLEAIGSVAEVTAGDLGSAKAAFEGLSPEQLQKVAKQLGLSAEATQAVRVAFHAASTQLASTAKQAGITAASLRTLTSALRMSLAGMGVTVKPEVLRMAAMYIQRGVITFDEAIGALAAGAQNASQVIRELAGGANNAARIISNAARQLYGISPPAAPPGGPPGAPPVVGITGAAPMYDPRQVLQLGAAISQANAATGGLMRSLLALRWELFTIMFFFYSATAALRSLANAAKSSAATVDRVSSAVTVLGASGVQNVDALVQKLSEASGYFLTTEEAARKLSRMTIIGLPPELIQLSPRLMEVARGVAVVSDEYKTAEEVFDKFVDAIARAQMRMATTTGAVSGTLEDALDKFHAYARAHAEVTAEAEGALTPFQQVTKMLRESGAEAAGSVEALDPLQKSLLITWTILAYGEPLLAKLGEGFDENTVKIQELDYSAKEISKTLGIMITELLGISKAAENMAQSMRGSFGGLAMAIDKLFAPERYAARMEEARQKAREILDQMDEDARARLRMRAIGELTAFRQIRLLYPTEAEIQQAMLDQLTRQVYGSAIVFETQARAAKEADESIVDYIQSLQDLLRTSEQATDTTESLADSLRGLQSSLTQFASIYVNYLNEIADAELEHARWYEDLMRDYRRRLEAIEEDQERNREKERADRDKKRQDAAEQLARRLWEIEQNLATRLLSIWRDYNEDMFMAELDRDALRAFLAARRRDREITEAQEAAERERQEAYMRYQDQLKEIEESYNRRIAEIEQRMKDEREQIQQWLAREREDRELYERRAEEDRRRNYERRYAEMFRSLLLEYELQRIMNDKSLSEEERFMRTAQAIFAAYNTMFATDAHQTYAELRNGASAYFGWLYNIFRSYYDSMLRYRNSIMPLLTAPIIPGGQTTPGQQPTPRPRGGLPYPFASGGVAFVSSPTRFLAGEAGPELVMAIPMGRVNTNLSHQFNAVITAAMGDITGRVNAAVYQALERVVREVRHG